MARPPSIARQLDRCDVCGRKIHKKNLVSTNVAFLAAEASNYALYSSYNSSFWTVDTSSDSGVISIGPYADRSRVSVDDSNTSTEILGSQTWEGAGTLRSSTGIDASAWTSLVFAADIGPYERETIPKTVFALGLCDSDGSNKEAQASFSLRGSIRAWFTINIADLPSGKDSSDLYFYINATPDTTGNQWWADRLQVEKDATKLGTFAPTSGTAVDRTDTASMTMRNVCANCREPLLSKSERYGRVAEQRTDEPITVDIQEI